MRWWAFLHTASTWSSKDIFIVIIHLHGLVLCADRETSHFINLLRRVCFHFHDSSRRRITWMFSKHRMRSGSCLKTHERGKSFLVFCCFVSLLVLVYAFLWSFCASFVDVLHHFSVFWASVLLFLFLLLLCVSLSVGLRFFVVIFWLFCIILEGFLCHSVVILYLLLIILSLLVIVGDFFASLWGCFPPLGGCV